MNQRRTSTTRKIEDSLTGILAMENVRNKIETLIPEIKRNGEKLRLLERNLDAEKLKLRRKIRKDENTIFSIIFDAEHLGIVLTQPCKPVLNKSEFFCNDTLSFHLFLVPMSNSKKIWKMIKKKMRSCYKGSNSLKVITMS